MNARSEPEPLPLLHFGGFTLDCGRRGLYRDGERVRLTSKPLETLIVLVAHRGQVVGKETLLEAVWSHTAVTEDVLVQAIGDIRRALGDDKDDPRFVQTVPREGYRFVADVREELSVPAVAARTIPPAPQARSRWWSVCLAGALVALAAGGIWWERSVRWGLDTRRAGPMAAAGTPSAPPRLRQLSFGLDTAVKPIFSPDGRTVLYVSQELESRGVLDLYVMPAAGGNSWRITDQADASGDLPVFTADGAYAVFCRYRTGQDGSRLPDLWIVPTFGGTPRLLIREASGAGFSPDGRTIAYTKHLPDRRALWSGPVDRPAEHRELAPVGFTPRWSCDGRQIAYTTSNPEGGAGDLWVSSATGASPRALTREPQQVYGLTWTADGTALVFASQRTGPFHLWRVPTEGGLPSALTAGVGEYTAPTVSPDGRTLVFSHFKAVRDLFATTVGGGGEPRALTSEEFHYMPRFSPSGARVASVVHQPDFQWHLCVLDAATKRRRVLGDRPARHPCWRGEGQVAYLTPAGPNQTEVRLVDLATQVDTPWATLHGAAEWLDIDSSGQRLAAVVHSSEGRQRIVVKQAGEDGEETIAEGLEYEWLRWRPDGGALAWSGPRVSARSESNGVWTAEPHGRPPLQVLADGYGPIWTVDGAGLYFSRYLGAGTETGLWRLDLATRRQSAVRSWKRVPYYDVAGESLVFAPDGGRGAALFAMPLDP